MLNPKTGLVPPYGSNISEPELSTSQLLRQEIEDANPVEAGKSDAMRLLADNVEPERVVSLILLMNAGLRQADAIEIVNSLAGTEIDPKKYKFKIEAKDMDMGPTPEPKKDDPYLARILAARLDAERILGTDTSLDQIENIVALRNNIKREHAKQIVSELMNRVDMHRL